MCCSGAGNCFLEGFGEALFSLTRSFDLVDFSDSVRFLSLSNCCHISSSSQICTIRKWNINQLTRLWVSTCRIILLNTLVSTFIRKLAILGVKLLGELSDRPNNVIKRVKTQLQRHDVISVCRTVRFSDSLTVLSQPCQQGPALHFGFLLFFFAFEQFWFEKNPVRAPHDPRVCTRAPVCSFAQLQRIYEKDIMQSVSQQQVFLNQAPQKLDRIMFEVCVCACVCADLLVAQFLWLIFLAWSTLASSCILFRICLLHNSPLTKPQPKTFIFCTTEKCITEQMFELALCYITPHFESRNYFPVKACHYVLCLSYPFPV